MRDALWIVVCALLVVGATLLVFVGAYNRDVVKR